MSKKFFLAFIIFTLAALPAYAEDLLAPLYPGSVAYSTEKPNHFLSKDSYEQVKDFYIRDRGNPVKEETCPEKGRYAFFEYMDVNEVHKYDPVGSAIGVRLYSPAPENNEVETDLKHVGEVFFELKGPVMHGSLSSAEYDRLVAKYRPLASCYFPLTSNLDHNGHQIPVDEVIFSRYKKDPEKESMQQDAEAMAQKVQALMAQGRTEEAMQIMQQLGQSSQQAVKNSRGIQGVEKWKKCLRELEENAYKTRIEIAVHPSSSGS
ncbi:MAG: hypothetical protein KGY38_04350 [Desulfobacterales bacterium]|nr:hypothetical protein [Desulfobacterales bacterium]